MAPAVCSTDPASRTADPQAHRHTIHTLRRLQRSNDPETYCHSVRVCRIASALARHMGLTKGEIRTIVYGALLHDIGKLAVAPEVLAKPGKLTEDEWLQVKQHPIKGTDLLEPVTALRCAIPVVRSHHERWDGGGYPDGLAGEAIPLAARIVAVADSLDAMTEERPYRSGRPQAEAEAELLRFAGAQFDPAVVAAYLAMG